MKFFNDKNTLIQKQKYSKREENIEFGSMSTNWDSLSNKEFKEMNYLIGKVYDDKIWWKLLPRSDKKLLARILCNYIFHDKYNLSEEQINVIHDFKKNNPLTKEIRDYKINILIKDN